MPRTKDHYDELLDLVYSVHGDSGKLGLKDLARDWKGLPEFSTYVREAGEPSGSARDIKDDLIGFLENEVNGHLDVAVRLWEITYQSCPGLLHR